MGRCSPLNLNQNQNQGVVLRVLGVVPRVVGVVPALSLHPFKLASVWEQLPVALLVW